MSMRAYWHMEVFRGFFCVLSDSLRSGSSILCLNIGGEE
jgi:hypothetical protein